jgi:hypothetical protein
LERRFTRQELSSVSFSLLSLYPLSVAPPAQSSQAFEILSLGETDWQEKMDSNWVTLAALREAGRARPFSLIHHKKTIVVILHRLTIK